LLPTLQSHDGANPLSKILASNQTIISDIVYQFCGSIT
jgi:hypothetical protein